MSKRVLENRPVGVYSYWEKNNKICTGSIKELAEKLNKTPNNMYQLSYRPTRFRRLRLEGYREALFELYTKNGDVVFTGTARQCEKYMCIPVGEFWNILYCIKTNDKKHRRTGRCGAFLARKIGETFEVVE